MTDERPYDLVERMRELGADDPKGYARSELNEDIPQEARYLVARLLARAAAWDSEMLRRVPSLVALLDAGASETVALTAVREVAEMMIMEAAHIFDVGCDEDAPEDSPGWIVIETRTNGDGETMLTGRPVDALHEDLDWIFGEQREGATDA